MLQFHVCTLMGCICVWARCDLATLIPQDTKGAQAVEILVLRPGLWMRTGRWLYRVMYTGGYRGRAAVNRSACWYRMVGLIEGRIGGMMFAWVGWSSELVVRVEEQTSWLG